MKTNYVLIDFENVQVKSLALLKDDTFRVCVFLGPANSKLPVDLVLAMQKMGSRAMYITLETSGKNALDFHIAYYLGVMSRDDPDGSFHIISKDSGFDPLIRHLKGKKILASRSASIEELPCLAVAPSPLPHPAPHAQPPPPMHHPAPPLHHPAPKEIQHHAHVAPAVPPESLIKAALGDLIKRKASRPRTLRTLLSTIHATCGKELSEAQIHAIYQTLVARGHVTTEGTRVTYSLPPS
ncbi:MAG: PIN domain-containing protein [bacterium]